SRISAAIMPLSFIDEHGGVAVENHVNIIRPIQGSSEIPLVLMAAILTSAAADLAFRFINGSVAVSAYELEALPLPAIEDIARLKQMVEMGANREDIQGEISRLYGINSEQFRGGSLVGPKGEIGRPSFSKRNMTIASPNIQKSMHKKIQR
ncbi:MAG TPA: hypothetical protein VFG19_08935, partial [Geobacteraceae bacterium]|nr:hypothetical protein [Geobacteraceae bacterium]